MAEKVGMDVVAQGVAPLHVVVFVVRRFSGGVRYLLMRRSGHFLKGNWQMVTGGIHQGETAVQAAVRELQEETGLSQATLYNGDFLEQFYDVGRDKIVFAPVFLALAGDKEQVRLSPHEHDRYEWLNYKEAMNRLDFQGQREALRHIHENLACREIPEVFSLSRPAIGREASDD